VTFREQKPAQQELEGLNLADGESEYWGRKNPDDLKDRAVNDAVEEDMFLAQGNTSRREHLELNRLWPSA
jgi:hypothetical protein